LIYTLVANVAAIPGSPSNNDAIEVTDSTNIQSFTPLSGVPVGFTGNSGLSVRIVYSSASSSWTWVQYFANDPENRYLGLAGGTMTGALTLSGAPTTSNQAATKQYVDDNGASVTSSDVAPSSPADGDLWYNSSDGRTYVYYNDGDSSQWVDMSPQGGGGPFGQGSAASPSVSFIGDTNTGLYSPGADQLALSTAGTGRLFIDSSGRLLVGTDTALNASMTAIIKGSSGGAGLMLARAIIPSSGSSLATVYMSDHLGGIGAWIDAARDGGTWTSGSSHPTLLRFATTADGASSPTERLRITSAGLVGIGTSTPDRILDIESAGSAEIKLTDSTNIGRDAYIKNNDGDFEFRSRDRNSNGTFVFLGYGGEIDSEYARFDSSGRLLVGTSSAVTGGTSQFSRIVALGNSAGATNPGVISVGMGATPASGNNIGRIFFVDNAAGEYAEIAAQCDGTPGSGDYPGRLVFSTTADGASSPTERMRITSGGGLRFNQATTDSPAADNVAGCALGLGGFVSASNTGSRVLELNRTENTTSNIEYVRFYRVGSANLAGTITATKTTTAYNTSSDYRLKENVVPLASAADRVNQLKPSQFNFIAEPDKTVDGFIAHEAQAVVPECVTGTKDEVDADGNPVYQGIDQSKLVPLLTAALQEAIGRIETLEAEVQALKGGN